MLENFLRKTALILLIPLLVQLNVAALAYLSSIFALIYSFGGL